MVIELRRGEVNEWSIVRNVVHAADALLSQQSYEVERRTRLVDASVGGKVSSLTTDSVGSTLNAPLVRLR